MQNTLQRLFHYKLWANDALLNALAELGSSSPITGLAIKALSHTYIVDQIFAAHLRRMEHTFAAPNLDQMPNLEDLSLDIRASDKEYLTYVSRLEPADLAERIDFTFTDGAPGSMTREEMLMHVITHGVGHRGQISAVMILNSRKPASDGFTTFLHTTEATTQGASRLMAKENGSGGVFDPLERAFQIMPSFGDNESPSPPP